jgi:hypothetical protein
MAKISPKRMLRDGAAYLRAHPEEILRAVRGLFGLRVGVPLDALRYFAAELARGSKAPRDVVIGAAPPGLRLEATVRAMGTTLRAKLVVVVEELEVTLAHARVGVRISDLSLAVLDGADTPLAGLVKSGALDLSKPGNLVAFMPKRPEALVEAEGDRVVVDLLRVPKIAENARARRLLAVLTPVVQVAAIRTSDDHLDVHFTATPAGIPEAVAAARS